MAPRCAITREKRDKMLLALRGAAYYRDAAEAAGIPWRTWMDWCKAVDRETCEDPDVIALVHEARIAYHSASTGMMATVAVATKKDWRAAAWLMDHRRGDPKARHDEKRARYEAEVAKNRAAGTHVETVRHVGELADDELDRRIRELEAVTKH